MSTQTKARAAKQPQQQKEVETGITQIAKSHNLDFWEAFEKLKNQTLLQIVESFRVEFNAKNQAYEFILRNGHLDSFSRFCNKN